ncbi:hypothetical protein ACEPAI_8863 [Sanghuangporus weigelae]
MLVLTYSCRRFYAYRVWIMSNKNRLLTFAALALNLVEFVSGMAFGIKTLESKSSRIKNRHIKIYFFNSFTLDSVLEVSKINWLGYMSLGSAVASDLWCSVCLCYYLAKDRTGFKATDTKLNTLMLYIISTGLLTGLCSICSLVLLAAMPYSYADVAVNFCVSKLYFNALLAMLNSRNYLRERTSGRSSDQGIYRLPQIVNIGKPASSEHETSPSAIRATSDKILGSGYKEC